MFRDAEIAAETGQGGATSKGMTEDELRSYIEQQEATSNGLFTTGVAEEQAKAMRYYLGLPMGNEEEGRSTVISSDVWDVVEGLTPLILKPFVSSDDVVSFQPFGPEDEDAAKQETDYINFVVTQKNDVFEQLVAWVKTGLLQKNGIVKYWWEKSRRVEIERYFDIEDDVYTALIQEQDPGTEVQVVEHTAKPGPVDPETGQPSMTHDVTLRIANTVGQAKFECLPPEEFLIGRDARGPNPKKSRFVQHRTPKTISDLREMGYDVPDDLSDTGSSDPKLAPQATARMDGEDLEQIGSNDSSGDASMREVLFKETYLLIDFDGDGIAELRKVCQVGTTLLANEETEEVPFCGWTPYQQPFKFYGRCPADEAIEIQDVKTTVWRQGLDNIYTINNNRTFVSDKVNMDDMVDNQIAGIVRVGGDNVSAHVMNAPIQPIGEIVMPMIEYLDSAKENRTGFTRYNQGTDANSLNKTATGIRAITEAGNNRVELVSRAFAEQGLKPLMLGIHGLCRRHGTEAETIRLRGKWVTMDPRDWKTRYDMSVSVGLGTSDKTMQIQAQQMILQTQAQVHNLGIVTPENVLAAASKLVELTGEKSPEKYFSPPQQQQPPDPTQDPQFQLKMMELKQKDRALDQADRALDQVDQKQGIDATNAAFDATSRAHQQDHDQAVGKAQVAMSAAEKLHGMAHAQLPPPVDPNAQPPEANGPA